MVRTKFKQDSITKPGRCNLTNGTETQIEHYRKLVLNPLSHHDIDKHEISSEINNAITTIKTLKTELNSIVH